MSLSKNLITLWPYAVPANRVRTRDAHARVQHHRDQEPRLAVCEAEFSDRLNAFVEGHFQNSSASPPWRPPPPLRPLIRALDPP
jgi:hypothetical protein